MRKFFGVMISLLIIINLTGCTIGPKFSATADGGFDDYEVFSDFDIRELEEQIDGYWSYEEQNQKEQRKIMREVEDWETDWITEGTYLVGQDIAEGVYIVRQGEKDILVRQHDDEGEISPIKYQGTGEGEGCYVYPNGMYKVGEDIPVGTYEIKNELYHAVTDLSYEGYHGNVSQYCPENWCGLKIKGSADEDGLQEDSSDRTIELDNRVNANWRTVKIEKWVSGVLETTYEYFWGLPTVTFTEADIGTYVSVKRCILIPKEGK